MLERWKRQQENNESHPFQDGQEPKRKKTPPKGLVLQTRLLVGAAVLLVALLLPFSIAWFTNISKTNDVLFEVEAWGVDEDRIQLEQTAPLSILPGANGVVPLSVDNSGNATAIKLSVFVSKENLQDEMKKRLYFYTDQPVSLTDEEGATVETAPRFYLGADPESAARYVVAGGEQLTLREGYFNDVPLKWRWVYDMEGYYFRGRVISDLLWEAGVEFAPEGEETSPDEMSQVTEEEYLRPVEYDYETAVFDPESGALQQAEGQTVEEFLLALSAEDGYPGQILAENAFVAQGKAYYPVEVDDTFYGVWCYLCDWDEIEAGIGYDNSLRDSLADPETDVAQVTGSVTLSVIAQNVSAEQRDVSTGEELLAALADEGVDVARLTGDLSLPEAVPVTDGMNAVLDLNGYTLTGEGEEIFSVAEGGSLTLLNGVVRGKQDRSGVGVVSEGGRLTLSRIILEDTDMAVLVDDRAAAGSDSVVKIASCEISSAQTAILVYGNGAGTGGQTQMVIQNSKITGEGGMGLSGQGTVAGTGGWGTSITLLDSAISGRWAGIYHPQQQSFMLIRNCTVSGCTGIAVKGGTVTLWDSEVTGNGTLEEIAPAAPAGGGFTDTGDGLYVEATYRWPATLLLKGENRVVSENAYGVELFGREGNGPGRVQIEAGDYTGAPGAAAWNGIGRFDIYGGAFHGAVQEDIQRFDQQTPEP